MSGSRHVDQAHADQNQSGHIPKDREEQTTLLFLFADNIRGYAPVKMIAVAFLILPLMMILDSKRQEKPQTSTDLVCGFSNH